MEQLDEEVKVGPGVPPENGGKEETPKSASTDMIKYFLEQYQVMLH